MKNLKYLLVGIVFGLALTKGEAISWFRIQEMFRFESFHMYGIFMTAIPAGALCLLLIRTFNVKTFEGAPVDMPKKEYHHGVILGSLIFGFGWAMTGACPGPLYAQIGTGFTVTIVTLTAALAGTWTYGKLQTHCQINQNFEMMRRITLILAILATCPAIAQDATTLIREGIEFHDKDDYAKAIELYQRAVAIDPTNGTAYYEMAYSYHLMHDYPNALLSSEKAIRLTEGPTKMMSMIVKGSVLDDSGNSSEALKVHEQANTMFPDQYLLHFNYGVTLTKVERYKDAEAAFISALQLNFSHPGSHLQLANLKQKLDQKAMAAMGLYFFLLLENESDRSKEASQSLLALIYPPKDSTNVNTISINLPPGGATRDGSAELYFGMLGVVSNDVDDQTKANRTQQEKFVADTESYFSVLSELAAKDSKKKKKKKEAAFNVWWDGYVPWFTDIQNAGHTEAFCYHTMKSTDTEEVQKWLVMNITKTDQFYAWNRQKGGN